MRTAFLHGLILTLALTAAFMAGSGAARAQDFAFSAAERVGFAFYRLSSAAEPPYEEWVRYRPEYLEAPHNIRLSMMDKERRRLRAGFSIFDPASDLIPVHTKADLVFMDNPDYVDNGDGNPDAPIKIMQINVPLNKDGELFFPFQLGKMWIAFIPMGFNPAATYPLTRREYQKIEQTIGVSDKWDRKSAPVEFILRPEKADGQSPVQMDGQETWLMTGSVVSVSLLDQAKNRVWDYMNDWYVDRDEKELKPLYTK